MKVALNKTAQSSVPDRNLPVSLVAKPGHVLHMQNGQYVTLGTILGQGGEGSVFKTNTPYVAKIYRPEKTTSHKMAKIQALLDKRIDCPGVCFARTDPYPERQIFCAAV